MNLPNIINEQPQKVAFWLGVLISAEQAVGQGTVSLTHIVPVAAIPYVQSWCTLLAWLGTMVMTGIVGYSTNTPLTKMSAPASSVTVPKAMIAFIIVSAALALGTSSAFAQKRAPTEAVTPLAASSLPIKLSYTPGAPHKLRILNPLGLPDPLCITDHPNPPPTCPADASGVSMTGDGNKDLASFLTKGGQVLLRDMKRADQYLSYPTDPKCTSGCTKTDPLSSSCIEAIIPLAELIINGPPALASATAATSTAGTPPAAVAPAPDAPITKADEGIVTEAAKADIILLALQGDSLKLGCGGWVQAKIQSVTTLSAGLMTFITTMAATGL